MKGYQHTYTLALAAESLVRHAFQADAHAITAASVALMESNMERALENCDAITALAAQIREARRES